LERLSLPSEGDFQSAEGDFPVFVPLEFLARMKTGDATDPLLMQVLATTAEARENWTSDALLDPVGDQLATQTPGLIQKYAGRALLIVSGACAVHCRYCFRRHFPYESAPKGEADWQTALDFIRQDPSIDEVILSGGDPLTMTDSRLESLINQLNQIPHVSRIRIHSRVPVVIPQRVCPELLRWVGESRAAVYFVLHFNHPHEINARVCQAMDQLRRAGASLLNQAVLLRAINDQPETQLELCRRLVNMQVLPYYLHQLDRVAGALHFETRVDIGHQIIDYLRNNLPGYAVPKFVREEAGRASKTPL
jgi:EF-P beta-lysylation protein EpmB